MILIFEFSRQKLTIFLKEIWHLNFHAKIDSAIKVLNFRAKKGNISSYLNESIIEFSRQKSVMFDPL